MDQLFVIASVIATVIPVMRAPVNPATGRLSKWGIVFLAASAVAGAEGFRKIAQSRADAQRAAEENRVLLSRIQKEGTRLAPADFSVQIFVSKRLPLLTSIPSREPMPLAMNIGGVDVYLQLMPVAPPANYGGGRMGSFVGVSWQSAYVTVDGLDRAPYLGDMSNSDVKIQLPIERMRPTAETGWSITVQVYAKGRLILAAQPDERGTVTGKVGDLVSAGA